MNSQSVKVNQVYLDSVGIIVGKLEKEGPLKRYFKHLSWLKKNYQIVQSN